MQHQTLRSVQPVPTHQYRVHKLALCYLLCNIAYAAISTMQYSLFAQKGLQKLALANGIMAYIGFGLSNPIALQIMRRFNLKKAIVAGFIGMASYGMGACITLLVVQKGILILSSPLFIWALNLLASLIAGVSNSLVWTAMPAYIQAYCREVEQAQASEQELEERESGKANPEMAAMMGTFWSIFMFSAIAGGLINIFVLGFLSFQIYAAIAIAISLLGIVASTMLLHPYQIEGSGSSSTLQQELANLLTVVRDRPNILIFNYVAGLALSFYIIFINKIIKLSLPSNISQAQLSRYIALAFLVQAVASILMGVAQSHISLYNQCDKRKSLYYALVLFEVALLLTVLAANLLDHRGYWFCIGVLWCWSVAEIHVKTALDAYVKQYLGGKVEYYSLGILLYSAGSITNYLVLLVPGANIEILVVALIFISSSIVWAVREPSAEYAKVRNDTTQLH